MMTGCSSASPITPSPARSRKEVFEAMWNGEGDADAVIAKKGLKQITDTGANREVIDEIIAKNPSSLSSTAPGKKLCSLFRRPGDEGYEGAGHPAQVNELLKKKLSA